MQTSSLPTSDRLLLCVCFACIAAGLTLRLAFPLDIEFKADEAWIFAKIQAWRAGAELPWVGMPTSMGPPFPGLSFWVFIGFDSLWRAQSPPELARAVQLAACAAILLFIAFAWLVVDEQERPAWYWGAALWAVNPLAIIFERKIWPPSVLPLPLVCFLAAWWFRRNICGAFLWGLLGALIAQIHLGAVFLVAALALWTRIWGAGRTSWGGWLAGTSIGCLPALPWLLLVITPMTQSPFRWRWPFPSHFLRWITQPFGFGVEYTLGRQDMFEYLAGPVLMDRSTYLMAAVHIGLVLVAVLALARVVHVAASRRLFWRSALFGGSDATGIAVSAGLWGYGIMMTALTAVGVGSHRHYLIVVAPLMGLWAARSVMEGDLHQWRRLALPLLAILCMLQVVESAGLLSYIHNKQIIDGEYGPTWQSQQSPTRKSEPDH